MQQRKALQMPCRKFQRSKSIVYSLSLCMDVPGFVESIDAPARKTLSPIPSLFSTMQATETAILIHGLWMPGLVFLPHQYWLERSGISAVRFSYPSWSQSLQSNAERLANLVERVSAQHIHLVAHSLGGLVALAMLSQGLAERIRRLVLMGTPYAGCYSGNYLAAKATLSPLIGHSMRDWLDHPPLAIPESVDIGVIAGTRSWGLGRMIPGLPYPNDGVVAVAETRLPQARDAITLPVSHSGMLLSPICAEQVACFLQTGSFIGHQ